MKLTTEKQKSIAAFICTHNFYRSQMAEAISIILAAITSKVAEIKGIISPDAVRVIQRIYGINMTANQHPKLLSELLPVDIVTMMGCGVQRPYLPYKHREDWGLDDPTGKVEDEFIKTAEIIKEKINDLISRILSSEGK